MSADRWIRVHNVNGAGKLIILELAVPGANAWVDLLPSDARALIEALEKAIAGASDEIVKLD